MILHVELVQQQLLACIQQLAAFIVSSRNMTAKFKSSVLHAHWSPLTFSSGLTVTAIKSAVRPKSNNVVSSGVFGLFEHKHGQQKVLRSFAVCCSQLQPGQRTPTGSGSAQRASASEKPVVEAAGRLSTPLQPQESLPEASTWDKTTSLLVSGATVVFFLLLVPQIIKNATNMMHGDLRALAAIAWVVRSCFRIPFLTSYSCLAATSFEP